MSQTAKQKETKPHVAPTPRKYRLRGVETTEFRYPKVLLGMEGMRYSDRKDVKTPAECRAQLDKSAFLRFASAIVAAASIERDGIDRNTVFRSTHELLAAMAGYKCRESYTRNASRAPQMVRRKGRALIKGCVYQFAFGESKQRWGDSNVAFTMPTATELRDNKEWKEYWRNARADYKGYFWAPGWIFNPQTPGTPYQKLVLLALAFLGLFKVDQHGQCTGELQKPLATIAKLLGTSRDQVRDALAFWQEEGILQVKEYAGAYYINGQVVGGWMLNGEPVKKGSPGAQWKQPPEGAEWRQPPNSIYYVAAREFDEEKCAAEMDRFCNATAEHRESPWFRIAAEIHTNTLREWRDTRQLVRTFWTECRKRMHKASIPPTIIEAAIPKTTR